MRGNALDAIPDVRWLRVLQPPEAGENRSGSRRAVEDRHRILFGTIDEGFRVMELVHDGEGRLTDLVFREVNAAFERLTGLRDVVGRTVREVLPNFEKHWIDAYTRVARTGVPERYENYAQNVDRWYRVHQSRVGGANRRTRRAAAATQ